MQIVERLLTRCSALILARQQECTETLASSEPGRRAPYAWPIILLSADKLAYITLKVVLNFNTSRHNWNRPVSSLCREVARRVRDEMEFERWKERETRAAGEYAGRPNWWQMMRQFAPDIDVRAFHKFRRNSERAYGRAERMEWSDAEHLQLGAALLELLVEAGPTWFELVDYNDGATRFVVVLSDEALKWIASRHEKYELMRPWLLPMLVEPFEWGKQDDVPRRVLHAEDGVDQVWSTETHSELEEPGERQPAASGEPTTEDCVAD